MMNVFLLQAAQQTYQACQYAGGSGTLQQSWVEISALVVLAGFAIATLIYTLGNILNVSFREKMKQLAKAEAAQAAFGLMIIVALIAFAQFSCNVSTAVTSQITGTGMSQFAYSNYYVANLLFVNGFGLIAGMYSTSIQYSSEMQVIEEILDATDNPISKTFANYVNAFNPLQLFSKVGGALSVLGFKLEPSQSLGSIYGSYASLYLVTFGALITISFASLLILFLMLPLIQYGALVVVVPVAIIMRLLLFTGPRLRDAADHLLAIGIAFYFILPLTLIMDSYIVSWTYCIPPMTVATGCNPYSAYTGLYTENSVTINNFFQGNTVKINNPFTGGVQNVPTNLFQDSQIPVLGASFNFAQIIWAPPTATDYAIKLAQYTFQSTLLIALDYAITLAFAIGLAKAFARVSGFFSIGQFW